MLKNVGLVVTTITNNSAGGQPVSLENIKEVSDICKKYNIPHCIDAARYAENAHFIKRDEEACKDAGIIYQTPVGGHGVFIDAKAMLPQIPYTEFPAQVLCIELYKEAGIRSCDIGSYMLGNDPDTGVQLKADFEFTRLAVPRRVYTQAHLDIIVDALVAIKQKAASIKHGYKITWEPPVLRHFQAHLELI